MNRPFRPPRSRGPQHRINGKIRAREVRVLDERRQQVGVLPLSDALRLARSRQLDLVEIAPEAQPPVCRIVDYGKFKYEEAKRGKESVGRQGSARMKEVQLTPVIDPHDLAFKLKHAIDFLCEGSKVRVRLRFRGRQMAHKELGFEVVNKFVQETAPWGRADSPPKMAGGRELSVLISPLPADKRARHPRDAKPAPAVPVPSPKPAPPSDRTEA